MNLKIELKGAPSLELAEIVRGHIDRAERAVTRAVHRAGRGLQGELRQQVVSAGLGRRVANAWRLKAFPTEGASIDAAAYIWSNAPKIIRAFDEGVVIRGRSGNWLAIPTENAPKSYGFKPISPSNWPTERFGPLRLVYCRNGPSLLVVDNVRINRRSGRVSRRVKDPRTKSGALRKGLVSVVMFLLVPQVRLTKRLDVDAARRHWESRLPGLIVGEWLQLEGGDG